MADYAKERKERKDREADRVAQDAWNKKQDKHEADKVEWRKRARSDRKQTLADFIQQRDAEQKHDAQREANWGKFQSAMDEQKKKKQELYDLEFSIRDISADLMKLTGGMKAPFGEILGLSQEILEARQRDAANDSALLNSAEKRAEASAEQIQAAENRLAVTGALGNLEKTIMTNMASGQLQSMSEEEILQKLKDDGLDITKLTVGEYKALEERIKNISTATEKLSDQDMQDLMSKAGMMDDTLKKWSEKTKMWGMALKNPAVAMKMIQASAIAMAISFAKDLFDGALKFKQELGLSAGEAAQLSLNVTAAAKWTKLWGGDASLIAASATEMVKQFGDTSVFTAAIAKDMAGLAISTGFGGANAATLLKNMEAISGASIETNINTLETWGNLAQAAGVSQKLVLDDVAKSTNDFARFAKDGGDNIIKAAIAASKLGLELSDVAKISDSLLNIEDSLTKEMEAEMLIGKQLNLDKARELALAGDLEGVMNEVKNIGISQAEWSEMNVIQREALAKAIGVSVGDMGKLIAGEQTIAQEAAEAAEEKDLADKAALVSQEKLMGIMMTMQGASATMFAIDKARLIIAAARKSKLGVELALKGTLFGLSLGTAVATLAASVIGIGAIAGVLALAYGAVSKGKTAGAEEGGEVTKTGTIKAHKGEVYSGTKNEMGFGADMTETNKLLKQSLTESRLLREQNELLTNKLIRKTGDLQLANA